MDKWKVETTEGEVEVEADRMYYDQGYVVFQRENPGRGAMYEISAVFRDWNCAVRTDEDSAQ